MVTFRNRRTPSGNCALIPANTETVRRWNPGIGDDSKRLSTLSSGARSKQFSTVVVIRAISYRMMFRRNSGPLLGVSTPEPKCGCLSANKGTREARSMRVISQPSQFRLTQVSLMMRTSGGVVVIVCDWENQLHGKGRQEVSCWIAEGFVIREGSR
jgi:hypothetical protein